MRVFATLKEGGDFNTRHLERLDAQIRQQVGRNLELLPLHHDFPGWWAKMNAFCPENRDLRPFLHLDLDTLVLGPLDVFDDYDDGDLWLLPGFTNPQKSNSGVMVVPKDTYEVWSSWETNPKHHICDYRGDSDFLSEQGHQQLPLRTLGILSYKRHLHRSSPPPEGTRLVCFHGNPRPWDIPEGYWPREYYEHLKLPPV